MRAITKLKLARALNTTAKFGIVVMMPLWYIPVNVWQHIDYNMHLKPKPEPKTWQQRLNEWIDKKIDEWANPKLARDLTPSAIAARRPRPTPSFDKEEIKPSPKPKPDFDQWKPERPAPRPRPRPRKKYKPSQRPKF